MIYTLTFNPAVDYILRLDSLEAGRVNRTASERICWGGKGINVSCVLKMLGVQSTALGFAAGFTGRALEAALLQQGIQTELITLKSGYTRICVKLFEENGERETEINPNGPEIDAAALESLYHKLDNLKSGDMLVLAGSVPRSLSSDIYERICRRTEGTGALIAADTSGGLLTGILKFSPFVVKPNHIEAGEICGFDVDSPQKAEACALRLRVMGAQNAIVSMAGDGAVLAAADGNVYHIGVPEGEVVNSVGAGDSMLAGFIAGYIATGSYETAFRWGAAAGSATAFSRELADRQTFDRLLKELEA